MKQALKYLLVASLLATGAAAAPALHAADSTAKAPDKAATQPKAAAEKGKAKREWYPFGGTVVSVNAQAGTIALEKKEGERVLKMDGQTKLEIDGKPAVLARVKVGDYAHGTLHKDSAGNEVIRTAKFDKEAPKKKKEAADKESRKTSGSKQKP